MLVYSSLKTTCSHHDIAEKMLTRVKQQSPGTTIGTTNSNNKNKFIISVRFHFIQVPMTNLFSILLAI